MEDPLTADWPSRVPVEEDEEEAQELIGQYAAQPEVHISAEATSSPAVAVLLVGQAAATLTGTLFGPSAPAGSIAVPELRRFHSTYEEELGSGRPAVHTVTLRAVQGSPLLLLECPRPLPAEQATVWARAVLPVLQKAAGRLLVVTTLPASDYQGPGVPADADLIFSLITSTASGGSSGSKGGEAGVPPLLPSGTALGGLPAALLAAGELRGLPAAAVLAVQAQPTADAGLVLALGRAARAVLARWGAVPVAGPPEPELRRAVQAAIDEAYRTSAGQSIFI